ncbi:MAG: hypothetical protein GWP91_19325, partial [Rhodobacterales bacterium]|nr:hypothetical protein [Rhodobacterales bacterium]
VTADDGQDLSGTTSAAVVVTDTVAPDAPTLDELDAYDNDSVYDVTGNGEANATITLTAVCDGTSSGQLVTNADPSGNFIFNFLSDLGETCTFTAFAVDADGNASGDSNQVGTTICAVPDPYEGGGYGDTQADAIDEWFPLPDNGLASYSLQGNILDNDPGDWFVVHGTDDTVADNVAFNNNYDFRVQVTDTSAQYTFVVHKGNLGSTILECASLSTNGYDDYNDFIFDSGDGPDHVPPAVTTNCRDNNASYNNCDDMTKSYYIQVIRDPAFTFDCTNYEITVTNNAP